MEMAWKLGKKVPVKPNQKYIFWRGKLGETLYIPQCSSEFDFSCDPFDPAYNALHDPHLKEFFNKKNKKHHLRTHGFLIHQDDKVLCSLKELNDYNNYSVKKLNELNRHNQKEKVHLEKQETNFMATCSNGTNKGLFIQGYQIQQKSK
ncbi:fibrous sheath-interacting protein 2 [Pyxicephalus adspersus]|uniref:fibrous sheath-interacting protein 2 n=1 Tax=Pyxicephalus adspersus TaxID=30357 RepID=UPI003B59223C